MKSSIAWARPCSSTILPPASPVSIELSRHAGNDVARIARDAANPDNFETDAAASEARAWFVEFTTGVTCSPITSEPAPVVTASTMRVKS